MEKNETKEKHQGALRKAILNVKVARVSSNLICIDSIKDLSLFSTEDLASIPDGEVNFSAEADIYFIPKDENNDKLSFGRINFHGIAIKNGKEYSIDTPIIIDYEFKTSLGLLKKWEK